MSKGQLGVKTVKVFYELPCYSPHAISGHNDRHPLGATLRSGPDFQGLQGLRLVPWGVYLIIGNMIKVLGWPVELSVFLMVVTGLAAYWIDTRYQREYDNIGDSWKWWHVGLLVSLLLVSASTYLFFHWEFPIWLILAACGVVVFCRSFPFRWRYLFAAIVCALCAVPVQPLLTARYFAAGGLFIFVGSFDHRLLRRAYLT